MDGVAPGSPRTVTPADDMQYVLMYGNSNDTCYDTVNVVVFDVPVAAISATPLQACMVIYSLLVTCCDQMTLLVAVYQTQLLVGFCFIH